MSIPHRRYLSHRSRLSRLLRTRLRRAPDADLLGLSGVGGGRLSLALPYPHKRRLQEAPFHGPSSPLGRSSITRSRAIGYRTKRQVGASVPICPSSTRSNPSRKNIQPKERPEFRSCSPARQNDDDQRIETNQEVEGTGTQEADEVSVNTAPNSGEKASYDERQKLVVRLSRCP